VKVSISEIKTFWACPQRWYWQYVAPKRTPISASAALTTGVVWHGFQERIYSGVDPAESVAIMETEMRVAINDALDSGRIRLMEDLEADLVKLTTATNLAATQLKNWLPMETLAAEKALSLQIPGSKWGALNDCEVVGRLDRIVRLTNNGKLAHNQHKTLGSTKPMVPYIESFSRSPHEIAYWWMMEAEYGEEPYGVVVDILRKLSPKTMLTSPESALQQHLVPISREQAEHGIKNIVRTINAMQLMIAHPKVYLFNNPDMDLGRYGNSLDPYFEVLSTGDESLLMDDSKFRDTEDRYAETVDA
jgi:PD-(D/E)XK nuclease superfamily